MKINYDNIPEELKNELIDWLLDWNCYHKKSCRSLFLIAQDICNSIKPQTYKKFGITIEGEPPLSEAPRVGEDMYFADLNPMQVYSDVWHGCKADHKRLASGLLFRTEEAAQALIDALKKAEERGGE